MKKKIRKQLIPLKCNRCGNDLMNGMSLLHLPYEKRYICFCDVCSKGLGLDHLFSQTTRTEKEWEDFWNVNIKEE